MTKKPIPFLLLAVLFAGVLVAGVMFLFPDQPYQPSKLDDTGSTKQGVEVVTNANNKFAFDLYSKLAKSEKGNIFYSPYSISAALALTYEGAKGKTAEEMKLVFGFPESSVLRPVSASIYNGINEGAKEYELRAGNALWIQQDFPLLAEYTSTVEKYYGGKATNLDFKKNSEKSRQTINSHIEEQTKSKIKNLIPIGFVDSMTRIVLTNAIYFKGTWQLKFDTFGTRDEDFKVSSDNVIKVPMMSMNPKDTRFNYTDTENAQIIELPYKGDKISMLVVLPAKDLASIESTLTTKKLDEYRSNMRETRLDLVSLPKFEFDTKYFMKDTLTALGMPMAFSKSADFSGMTGSKELFLDFVIHQAYLKVDEKGTEAAAATVAGEDLGAAMPGLEKELKVFKADRPFIFVIQDKDTGIILFIGKVVNPLE